MSSMQGTYTLTVRLIFRALNVKAGVVVPAALVAGKSYIPYGWYSLTGRR
jgi:hypothetical protein